MRPSDILFFASGLSALVYQTVWARLLARRLGSDAGGVAVVLAVFMAGLAIGSALCARPARRTQRPVALFVAVELLLAAWAILSPRLLAGLPVVDGLLARAGSAALVLLGPTALMGATFPLMGRLVIARRAETGRATSSFYGANTLGAAAGAVLGPFVLMPRLGLEGALLAAGGLELCVALGAGLVLRAPDRSAEPAPRERAAAWMREPVLWATALLGASALALEVLLTRVLVTLSGASIYAFAIVLATFLAGLGLGARWIDAGEGDGEHHARWLGRTALAIPPLVLAGLAIVAWRTGEHELLAGPRNRMPIGLSVARLWLTQIVIAALALLPPTLAFGRALPSAVATAAARRPERPLEEVLAAVYASNTLGALLGALAAAFVLLPLFGLAWGIALALVPSFAAAALVRRRASEWSLAGLATVVLGLGLAGLMGVGGTGGAGELAVRRIDATHDAHASIAVDESPGTPEPVRSLRVNGKVVATTAPVDLRLQRVLGHVPALLHGSIERALVIGMGTGMTAGSLLDQPTLEELVVVEISRALPAHGAAHFAAWNGDLLHDPRTRVVFEDGRHHLARHPEAIWDLITSDPMHPWTAGSSDLFSLEHFERMSELLAPGGIASQWLPLYQLSERDVRTVVATWCAAFEHTSAWLSAYDLVLVGSTTAHGGPAELLGGPVWPERVTQSLAGAGVRSPVDLAALHVADDRALRAFCAGEPAMRDDRPVLEFRAPLSYLAGYSVEALRWAARAEGLSLLPEQARPRGVEVREALGRFLARLPHGWSAAAEQYGRELIGQ